MASDMKMVFRKQPPKVVYTEVDFHTAWNYPAYTEVSFP